MNNAEFKEVYNDLRPLVRTTGERDALFEEIDTIISKLYDTDPDSLDVIIASQARTDAARIISHILAALNVSKNSKAVEEALEDIKKYLHERDILRMDIAFEPNEETTGLVGGWVSRNIAGHVLVEFVINRTLIGGVRISFQGRYKEVTLTTLIDLFLKTKDRDIENMLRVA